MNTKYTEREPRPFNLICIGLMALMLILQFVPFWHYDGVTSSINGYVWLPTDHAGTEAWLQSQIGDWFTIQYLFAQPVLQLLLAVVGIIVCIAGVDYKWPLLLPVACGIVGMWGYLTEPALQLGSGWIFHLIVCIAMIVAAAIAFIPKTKKSAA